MKALVIGGTGPVGPYVVEGLFKRGYQVAILHRGTHEIEFPVPVEHLHGDPHFLETLEETLGAHTFDLVISMYGRLRYTAQVMKERTPRFIAVVGLPYKALIEGEDGSGGVPVPIPENAPLFTDKERHKFTYLMVVSEQVVMDLHNRGYYDATLLRFPFVYGPRQVAPLEWSIIRRILDGRKQIIIPDGGLKLMTRGYAENMAHAVLLAVDRPEESAGQIYNTGDDTLLSIRNWVSIVVSVFDYEWELVSMPFELARPSRPYCGRVHHQVTDTTKIKTELGYQDIVPVEEGIRRTVKWYLDNRPQPGGEMEQKLGDPFNYAIEDQIIQEYKEAAANIRESASVGYRWRHPYDHPRTPERTELKTIHK